MTAPVHHVTHPLIQHKLTLMRQKDCSTNSFRRLMSEISMLMAYEVTRDMPTQLIDIETPLEAMKSPVIDGKKTVFVSIMRAGGGFLDGMLTVEPDVADARTRRRWSRWSTTSRCLRTCTSATRSSSTRCWPRATRRWQQWTG